MTCIFDELLVNLEEQLKAMVDDDLDSILAQVSAQELMAERLQKRLSYGEPLSPLEEVKVRKVALLLHTNQLLAQQSLSFSRRMIKLLVAEEGYNEDGVSTTVKSNASSRVDIRA